jgi:DUF971 family protein
MTVTPEPTQLTLADKHTLLIEWSDGQRRIYSVAELRQSCPCAGCNSERSHAGLERGEPLPMGADVTLQQMSPVGNYAYAVHFSDGHQTGIFPLELLVRLGERQA